MEAPSVNDITLLRKTWNSGDVQALEKLTSLVFQVSPETEVRDWKRSKIWLPRELHEGNGLGA